jgi:hypothetical protein
MTLIHNFSISGIYEHYSCGGPMSQPGAITGFIHRTMYFPHQDDTEISRIIKLHSRFIVVIQQNEYAVSLFQRDIQPQIHAANKPYVIITGMDDMTFPEAVVGTFFDTLAQKSPLFCRWFATNCRDRRSPCDKITPIPYGIDYWTLSRRQSWTNTPMASAYTQDRHLSQLRKSTVHFSKRYDASSPSSSSSSPPTPRIYINFQFNLDGNGSSERLSAYQTIPRDLMSIQETPCNRYDTWGAYSQHVFVASPRGNGLDTIRTWEALMMGCIVIVRRLSDTPAATTVMEELYADLPVVIIDRWSDITRDFLDRILSEYSQRTFRYDKLTMKYWIDRIEAAFNTDLI